MRRHGTHQRTAVVLLLFIFALVIILGIIDHRVHQAPPGRFLAPPPNRFRITKLSQSWRGQPVYRIENITNHTLQRVVPGSWSEQVIPILYKGDKLPRLGTLQPNLHPPFDLRPGQSLWIVASRQYPYQLTVIWMDHGRDRYQIYEISK